MFILKKIVAFFYSKIKKCYEIYKIQSYKEQMNKIGDDSVIEFPLKLIGGQYINIGSGFYCGPDSRLEAWDYYKPTNQRFTPKITIGNSVKINGGCHIGAIDSIKISDNVLMGNGVFITDHSHGNSTLDEAYIHPNDRELYSKGEVVIGENVWLCERVIILPNVKIGKGSIVAANSVVTKDVPEYTLVAGNPAKVIKKLKLE